MGPEHRSTNLHCMWLLVSGKTKFFLTTFSSEILQVNKEHDVDLHLFTSHNDLELHMFVACVFKELSMMRLMLETKSYCVKSRNTFVVKENCEIFLNLLLSSVQ